MQATALIRLHATNRRSMPLHCRSRLAVCDGAQVAMGGIECIVGAFVLADNHRFQADINLVWPGRGRGRRLSRGQSLRPDVFPVIDFDGGDRLDDPPRELAPGLWPKQMDLHLFPLSWTQHHLVRGTVRSVQEMDKGRWERRVGVGGLDRRKTNRGCQGADAPMQLLAHPRIGASDQIFSRSRQVLRSMDLQTVLRRRFN